jgi:hypothetical protein
MEFLNKSALFPPTELQDCSPATLQGCTGSCFYSGASGRHALSTVPRRLAKVATGAGTLCQFQNRDL